MTKFRTRTIRETVSRSPEALAERKAACAAFRARVKAAGLTLRRFARLWGFPENTVYTWSSQADSCVPPPPPAIRDLALIELDPSVMLWLEEIAGEECAS